MLVVREAHFHVCGMGLQLMMMNTDVGGGEVKGGVCRKSICIVRAVKATWLGLGNTVQLC